MMTATDPNAFLTHSDRAQIAMALRCAADTYNLHAHTAAEAGHPRIAEQFDRQEKSARLLAERFED